MSDKKYTAFRCPEDLMALIESEMRETRQSKTDVIVARLMMAYGVSEEPAIISQVGKLTEAIADMNERLEALEDRD